MEAVEIKVHEIKVGDIEDPDLFVGTKTVSLAMHRLRQIYYGT